MDKYKSKKEASVSNEIAFLTEVQLDILVFPFVQNKDNQYSDSHLDNTSLFLKQREVTLIAKRSATRGAEFVPITMGIPTICIFSSDPNLINSLSNK